MVAGREINRSKSLRGTPAFRARNWFIFVSMSMSLLMGAGLVYLCRDELKIFSQRVQEEKVWNQERRDRLKKIYAIREKEAALEKK